AGNLRRELLLGRQPRGADGAPARAADDDARRRRLRGRPRALDARLTSRRLPLPDRLGSRERVRPDGGATLSAEALLERELERFDREHPRSRELANEAKGPLLSGVPMPWMIRWPGG